MAVLLVSRLFDPTYFFFQKVSRPELNQLEIVHGARFVFESEVFVYLLVIGNSNA